MNPGLGQYGAMTPSQTPQQRRARFFEMHARPEVFVMPNPYDVGSAKMPPRLPIAPPRTTR